MVYLCNTIIFSQSQILFVGLENIRIRPLGSDPHKLTNISLVCFVLRSDWESTILVSLLTKEIMPSGFHLIRLPRRYNNFKMITHLWIIWIDNCRLSEIISKVIKSFNCVNQLLKHLFRVKKQLGAVPSQLVRFRHPLPVDHCAISVGRKSDWI